MSCHCGRTPGPETDATGRAHASERKPAQARSSARKPVQARASARKPARHRMRRCSPPTTLCCHEPPWGSTLWFRVSAFEWKQEEEELYTNCFAPLGFRRAQFSRLLRLATFVRVDDAEADVLTVQGEPILDLFVPLNGTIEVRVGGAVAATLPPYQLVGEASLLENLQSPRGEVNPPARATVVAAPGSFYVRWSQRAFYDLQQEEDSDFAYAIQLMIARTLSEKLSAARLSQKESEERLKGRLQAARGGASPMALAAKRMGRDEPGTATGGSSFGGAAAEVEALLELNKEKESRVRVLERSLAESKTELADLQVLVTILVSSVLLLVTAGFVIYSLPSEWWGQSFTELARGTDLLEFS